MRGKLVLVQMDNSTAVAYMNHMGGAQSQMCNQLARDIWDWCIGNKYLGHCHFPARNTKYAS